MKIEIISNKPSVSKQIILYMDKKLGVYKIIDYKKFASNSHECRFFRFSYCNIKLSMISLVERLLTFYYYDVLFLLILN